MRLGHLHFNRPIPYTWSLALQNKRLEQHFRHKDLLRAQGTGKGDDGARGVNNHEAANAEAGPLGTRADTTTWLGDPTISNPLPNQLDKILSNAFSRSHPQLLPDNLSAIEDDRISHPPDPVLITFSTTPTYTVGRRHLQTNPISSSQQSFLSSSGAATFHASPRGGLLTYHGPGQLTGYIVADLRRHGITPRCWVRLLENSVMNTCAALGVENTTRTDDPGVWMKDTDRKICAIGVQVSRGITSHGVGLNVYDRAIPVEKEERYAFTNDQRASNSYDAATRGYLSWGFSRIVACGLEGKSVTWLTRERPPSSWLVDHSTDLTSEPNLMSTVAHTFAREVGTGINLMKASGKEQVDSVYRFEDISV